MSPQRPLPSPLTKRVAVMWRGEQGTSFAASGLSPIGRALQRRGDVALSQEAVDDVRTQLVDVDSVLVR